MKIYFLHVFCLLMTVCVCLSGCALSADNVTELAESSEPAPAGEKESICLQFVQDGLTYNGGVYTNYLDGESSGELALGHEVLSESQGLMLCYYAACSDCEWYEKTLAFIQDKLDTGEIISYRLTQSGSVFTVNASVDDLRITRGLLEGAKTFSQPEYSLLCEQYAERLYRTNVDNNFLLDYYDETYSMAGRLCTLCYSDLKTMQMLGESDKRWLKVEKKMRRVVLDGYIGNDFPFFAMQYQPDTDSYTSGNIRMTEAMLTVLHLSEVGICPAETVNWVKDTLSSGAIYGEYTLSGKPATSIESTAVYALCAMLGVSENEPQLVQDAMDKLTRFQITDKQSELYGAFAFDITRQVFSFDNLLALAALRQQSEYFAASEKGDIN